jgi:hypothetical protein
MRPQRTQLRRRTVVEVTTRARPVRQPARVPRQETPSQQYSWKTRRQAEDRKTTLKNKLTQLHGLLALDEIIGGDGTVLEGDKKEQWLDVRKTRLREAELEMAAVRAFLRESMNEEPPDPAPGTKSMTLALAVSVPSDRVLLGRCYRLLTALDEREVDLGEEGEALLSEMEQVMPMDVLLGEEETKP